MPCRSASPFLVPARHSFALRVPARLSLRLFQAFPIAAQSTATDVPRLLLHSKRNRKIPPPPENFGVWGAVRTRAIPPSAALFRRRCRFHSGCKKLIIQMPPWSQNCPFATQRKIKKPQAGSGGFFRLDFCLRFFRLPCRGSSLSITIDDLRDRLCYFITSSCHG